MQSFIKELKTHKGNLSPQQYRTIRGQAIAGDIDGANKGLRKLLKRM